MRLTLDGGGVGGDGSTGKRLAAKRLAAARVAGFFDRSAAVSLASAARTPTSATIALLLGQTRFGELVARPYLLEESPYIMTLEGA